MDAATLTIPPDSSMSLYDGSYFHKMLRKFPWSFRSGSKRQREYEAENLSRQQTQNANDVNDMIRGKISPNRFDRAKSTLLEKDGEFFNLILEIKDSKIVLPNEIGKCVASL
jgi:hypothetical protein